LFLDAIRKQGWTPGRVPRNVLFTYARFERYLATEPDLYSPNHMLGAGPGRFFLVNASDGEVGINCLDVGAPNAAGQLALQATLGAERFLNIGTAGGLQRDMHPGDVVVAMEALRDASLDLLGQCH
jgi:nucleoside phosphorylase